MEIIEKIGEVTLNYSFYDKLEIYSDGDEVEEFILKVFKEEKDIFDVLNNDDRWSVLYHLSPRRGNIVSPMDITKNSDVLEIGAGTGAVTEALSIKAGSVDCVELSGRRSLINAYRNKNRNNINVFVGNFEKIHFTRLYDVVVLIGVLEYSRSYIKSEKPFLDFLTMIKKLLKPGGKLYIAIENRLGMKYFSGVHEDHWGIPFVGIEGYITQDILNNTKTFTKSELEALLDAAGFISPYFYYPFPDYKLPTVIYSDDRLPLPGERLPPSNVYDSPCFTNFNENSALESLIGSKEFKVFSNSFLVEVNKQ
jgi:SAM-dependent methyltransferase